jgi:hypothetical protein
VVVTGDSRKECNARRALRGSGKGAEIAHQCPASPAIKYPANGTILAPFSHLRKTGLYDFHVETFARLPEGDESRGSLYILLENIAPKLVHAGHGRIASLFQTFNTLL